MSRRRAEASAAKRLAARELALQQVGLTTHLEAGGEAASAAVPAPLVTATVATLARSSSLLVQRPWKKLADGVGTEP